MIGSKNRNLKMQHNLQRIGGENNRYNYTFIQPIVVCLLILIFAGYFFGRREI